MVSRVRSLAGTRRVGHAGTLDPMATGLLIIDGRIEGPGISITAGAMDLNTPPEGAVLSFTGGVRLLYQPED